MTEIYLMRSHIICKYRFAQREEAEPDNIKHNYKTIIWTTQSLHHYISVSIKPNKRTIIILASESKTSAESHVSMRQTTFGLLAAQRAASLSILGI